MSAGKPSAIEDLPIISRAEAKAMGLTRYFTGKPCARGHVAGRMVCNWTCLECIIERDLGRSRDAPDFKAPDEALEVKCICTICGGIFWKGQRARRSVCSKACLLARQREAQRRHRVAHRDKLRDRRLTNYQPKKKICVVCGTDFTAKRLAGPTKTCSPECRESRRKQTTHEYRQTPEFLAKRKKRRRETYFANVEASRAEKRAAYARNRDNYRKQSKEKYHRMRLAEETLKRILATSAVDLDLGHLRNLVNPESEISHEEIVDEMPVMGVASWGK